MPQNDEVGRQAEAHVDKPPVSEAARTAALAVWPEFGVLGWWTARSCRLAFGASWFQGE